MLQTLETGPPTVLSHKEEIVCYSIQMADMGYGLTREAVMHMVYVIVEKFQRDHPFTNEKAGRWCRQSMSIFPVTCLLDVSTGTL